MLRGFTKMRCPHCGHIFIAADIEDNATIRSMPVHCPECGTTINLDNFVQKLINLVGKVRKTGAKLILVVLMFWMMMSCAPKFLRDGVTPEEMSAATAITNSISPAEILQKFQADGVTDESMADYFNASRHVIARLRDGETIPTASMEATIRGSYTNYLLLGRSWKWLACKCPPDQWYAFPNPLMEKDVSGETFTSRNAAWVYTRDKDGKKVNTRAER